MVFLPEVIAGGLIRLVMRSFRGQKDKAYKLVVASKVSINEIFEIHMKPT